jgi:AcrR family transcriptional regulator
MARRTAEKPTATVTTTQRHLEEMQQRVAEGSLPAGPADRELTEMKQRLIVEGASKVLFEKGFGKTSIRDIASACGMSMGQLYHYISSKDDILYLMHRHSQEMWHQHLADAGFEQITDPVAKLEHGLRISIKYLSENRDLMQFIYSETKYLDREHLRQVLEMDDQNVVGFYRHLLSEIPGHRPPERENELAANLIAFICVFLALRGWNLRLTGSADVDAAVGFLVDFIFRGLGIERGLTTEEASTCW